MWKEYKGLCRLNGISYQVFTTRVKHLGWEPERAATQKVNKRKIKE